MAKLSSKLFKLSRKLRDIETITSGSPVKMARRGKNKQVGRRIGKLWTWPF